MGNTATAPASPGYAAVVLNPAHKLASAWKAMQRQPLLRGWEWVLVTFVASRLIIFAIIYLARMEFGRGLYWHPGGVFTVLLQFDAELWYIEIARAGYTFSPVMPSSMGFFPFYPLLIKAASPFFPDIRLAALVVAHVCFFIAGLLVNALINLDYTDRRVNRVAITLLMFGPVSLFFSNAYSEPTFLMLAAGAFLAARKDRWLVASLCGMCLSATRNIGVVIALPLFIEYVRSVWKPGVDWKTLLHPRVLLLGLIPLGLALFLLYGKLRFGDFFAYFKATAVWGRTLTTPMQTIRNASALPVFLRWCNGGLFAVAVCVSIAGVFMRLRASYLIWSAILLAIYICGSSLEAVPRYISVVFPLFIILGLVSARFPKLYLPLLGSSVALLTLHTILSASGFWIT